MRGAGELRYDNVPGVKDACRLLIKALIRKFYIRPKEQARARRIKRNFDATSREIHEWRRKSTTRIPKIIHYIWVGGNPKPASVQQYIESWKTHCPDYLIVEWNEENYDITVNRYTKEAYQSKKWAFVTDFMRLDILDQFGGIYADSDIEILKNLDEFLDKPAFTSFETGDPEFILMPTGIMGAEQGNTWIQYLKTYYDNDRPFILADGSFDINTNTNTITTMTREKYGLRIDNTFQENEDFAIYPSDYFCPKSWSTGQINLTDNSHTIHHFAGSWK